MKWPLLMVINIITFSSPNTQNIHIFCAIISFSFFHFDITPFLQAEAQRREVEVRKLGEDLVEIRRKNRVIQDKVKEQIDVLQRKLEEYKIEHKAQEESLEDEIVAKEDLITSVKQSIEFRMKGIELDTSETKLSEEERYKRNTGCPKSKFLKCLVLHSLYLCLFLLFCA